MIIVNTTFHVHKSVDNSFKKWVVNDYIPKALNSGYIVDPNFARILIEVQEDCSSYAVSFKCVSIEDAVRWHDGEGAEERGILHSRYGERVLFFTTYMEEIHCL